MIFRKRVTLTPNRLPIRLATVLGILTLCAFLYACDRRDEKPAGPPEKVTIAISATTDAVLAEVAMAKGFFRQEGLEVTPRLHPYGKPALQDVLEGKADFATVAETPVMFAVMNGGKISIIATIESSRKGNVIVARKDRGILALKDIKGKRVAITPGTTTEFYLDVVLAVNGIARDEVSLVKLKAEEMADALAKGDVDASSMFNTYAVPAQRRLGEGGIAFHDENVYTFTFNVVASQEYIRNNPDKVKKLIRALIRSEDFVRKYPAAAQEIVADFTKIDVSIVRDIWADTSFEVSLDQTLILALEDESRWAIKHGLTDAKEFPNFLDHIYFEGLRSVRPEAVRIMR